jgi:hypothetical protein
MAIKRSRAMVPSNTRRWRDDTAQPKRPDPNHEDEGRRSWSRA